MSHVSFENFARVAGNGQRDDTEIAGRYAFQAEAERQILPDVLSKLAVQPSDRLLDIGCGSGNLLLPLAYFVAEATGIDNAPAIERLRARAPLSPNLRGLAGDFMSLDLPQQGFDKVLVYSVLQYLSSRDEVLAFVDKALSLCAPGGRLLLGDLPNRDRKARFAASPAGLAAQARWQAQVGQAQAHAFNELPADDHLVVIDDALVLALVSHLRRQGVDAWLLPQPAGLPFGCTREDLLITLPS